MGKRAMIDTTAIYVLLVSSVAWFLAIIDIDKAGIFGSMLYLFAQHERGKAYDSLAYSIPVLSLFGYTGSWVVTHIIVVDFYTTASSGMTQFMSAVFGFIAYDAILMMAGKTESMVKAITDMLVQALKRKIK